MMGLGVVVLRGVSCAATPTGIASTASRVIVVNHVNVLDFIVASSV